MWAYCQHSDWRRSTCRNLRKDDDMYHSILIKTLADRLAEATAEWLHYKIRTEIWAYVPNEELDKMNSSKLIIRNSPCCWISFAADQSVIFILDKIITLKLQAFRYRKWCHVSQCISFRSGFPIIPNQNTSTLVKLIRLSSRLLPTCRQIA